MTNDEIISASIDAGFSVGINRYGDYFVGGKRQSGEQQDGTFPHLSVDELRALFNLIYDKKCKNT